MADLNERETKKLIAIKKVLVGEYTKKEASDSLGLTIRQIDRLLNKLREQFYYGARSDLSLKQLRTIDKVIKGEL